MREMEILLGIDRTETLPGLLTKARLPRFPCRSLDKRYERRTCPVRTVAPSRIMAFKGICVEAPYETTAQTHLMMNERESGSIVAHHYINYPYNQVGYIPTIILSCICIIVHVISLLLIPLLHK